MPNSTPAVVSLSTAFRPPGLPEEALPVWPPPEGAEPPGRITPEGAPPGGAAAGTAEDTDPLGVGTRRITPPGRQVFRLPGSVLAYSAGIVSRLSIMSMTHRQESAR